MTTSLRIAMSMTILWCLLVLLQLLGPQSQGFPWFRYLFIGWGTVLAVW